jgi:protein-disulfide isomerase
MIQMVRRLLLSMLMLAFAPVSALAGPLPAVTAADRSIGRADAPVTVVEYASFACSHCADWHQLVYPEFKRRFIDTGQVRLVFRNLPTNPPELSMPAAALARCATPERFYDVAGALMQGQRAVLYGGDRTVWFDSAIAVSGRTRAEIDACVVLPATRAAINADIDGAVAMGVDSTPTLFVNGQPVADHSLGGLATAIAPLVAAR